MVNSTGVKHSSLKKTIFSIAIALLTVFFIAYATVTIYPGPKSDDFCEDKDFRARPNLPTDTKESCEAEGGIWNEGLTGDLSNDNDTQIRGPSLKSTGWCDYTAGCWDEYREAKKPYERNLFVIHIVLGVIILIGAYFLGVEAVSSGLMGGGVLLLVYGSIRYWGELPDVFRTLILGIALAVLIWTGYKKLK